MRWEGYELALLAQALGTGAEVFDELAVRILEVHPAFHRGTVANGCLRAPALDGL